MMRRHGRQTPAADGCHADTLGLYMPSRLRVVTLCHERLLTAPNLQGQRTLACLRQKLRRLEAIADLGSETQALQPTSCEHDRVELTLSTLPQPRIDVPAKGLDRSEGSRKRSWARRRTEAVPIRIPGCSCAAPQSASRGSSRRRYAPTARPSALVEVMSFAECTATSMRSPSNASSSSLTKTPRSPISPNGLVRSRSPAVVIGTRAISTPGLRTRSAARPAWVSASLLPRVPTRSSIVTEVEQMPHRICVHRAISSGGSLLQPHRGQMQQLVENASSD